MFPVFRKSVIEEYYINEKGHCCMNVRDIKDRHKIWNGSIPKLQFIRAFFVYLHQSTVVEESPILDNGDITPS